MAEQERIDKNLRQQIDDAQKQISNAGVMLDTPEFKQQMEDAKRQMAEATARFNSPEFRQQMEDAQRQMLKARTMFDSPAFKRQMDELQKQFQSEEFQRWMNEDSGKDSPSPTGNTPVN